MVHARKPSLLQRAVHESPITGFYPGFQPYAGEEEEL